MATAFADMVRESTTTTGTGTYDLAGASTGYQGIVAAIGTGNTSYFKITDGTDWEIIQGTVTDATPDTLSRDSVLASSNSGSAVNWGAGTKTVDLVAHAALIQILAGLATFNMQDQTLQRPKLLDYGETVNAIGSIGGGTQDIDLTSGNVVTGTVDTSETTFTFSNPPASGTAGSFTLILTNGGSQTVNWPASVDWAGGTAPTLTTAGMDVLTFMTVDGGTTWYGFASGLDMQ